MFDQVKFNNTNKWQTYELWKLGYPHEKYQWLQLELNG